MLKRLLAVGVLVTGLFVALGGQPALAGASCPVEIPWCIVTGGSGDPGGTTGGGDDGGGGGGCYYKSHPVACFEPSLGYYNMKDKCYYMRLDPQPPASDPLWGSHSPADGAIYRVSCFNAPPPWGSAAIDPFDEFIAAGAGGPTPAQLAAQALAAIRLDGPAIQMAPTLAKNGVGGLVGLPVWMWTTVNEHTWGPIGNNASSGAVTVTITANAAKIVWHMGDGGKAVTCTQPGEVYSPADGGRASSNCGYMYTKSSFAKPGHKYTIRATTFWTVNWVGGGQNGTIHTSRTSTASVRINEQQVVVK